MPKKSPLPQMWNVPRVFRDRLGETAGRQRIMYAEGHLLIILHQVPKADETERGARLFWRTPEGQWQSNNLGPGIGALQKHLAEYGDAVEELDRDEERADSADDYFRILRWLAPLRRSTRNLYDTLQQARETVAEEPDLIVCRDRAYGIQRAAELLQSDTQSALDCDIARRMEEQAQSSYRMSLAAHRLNVLAAIFLPIATIASIFGMNLGHGLEEALVPWPFVLILGLGIGLGFLIKAAIVENIDRPRSE